MNDKPVVHTVIQGTVCAMLIVVAVAVMVGIRSCRTDAPEPPVPRMKTELVIPGNNLDLSQNDEVIDE